MNEKIIRCSSCKMWDPCSTGHTSNAEGFCNLTKISDSPIALSDGWASLITRRDFGCIAGEEIPTLNRGDEE